MGKKIDGFVLVSIISFFLYVYFMGIVQNRIMAILLSLAVCILGSKLLRTLGGCLAKSSWNQRRRIKKQAGSCLLALACMEADKALAHIDALLKKGYDISDFKCELIQLHPCTQLSREAIFNAWRKHAGAERLVVCTSGKCDPEARVFASGLSSPHTVIVDGKVLLQLIAEHPAGIPEIKTTVKKRRLHFRTITNLLLNRKNAPRCILVSFSMLAMYVFSSNFYYLLFALVLLFLALASFRRAVRPAKLF